MMEIDKSVIMSFLSIPNLKKTFQILFKILSLLLRRMNAKERPS